jgi:hypothetical protein
MSRAMNINIRPDSYIGFIGNERSVDKLVDYLCQWFPLQKDTPTGEKDKVNV